MLSAPGSCEGKRLWLAMTGIDSQLFGEVVCTERWRVTQHCSGSIQRDFFKRRNEAYLSGTPNAQLPGQKGKRIVDTICSHSVQLGRLTKKGEGEMFSEPQLSTDAYSGEHRPLYVVRAVGWELCNSDYLKPD